MSLFTKLFEAVHSWRRRRGGLKTRNRADLAMEQLDHRQLLAVNFTGIVPIDFPATQNPGVVVIPSPPNNTVPRIPPNLASVINVSGFQINELRVSYTAGDDTLSVGIEGPPNGRDGRQVIAGDSDNNGNSATVDPRISNSMGTGIDQGFMDPADMGGTKTYGVFLDLNNPNVPDVVAGFPQGGQFATGPKPFEVARAIPAPPTIPPTVPSFDPNNILPQYTGNFYLANDPNRPNFELQIAHFSQLYQQFTGKALTPQSQFRIGAFGTSAQDGGISDEYFPPQALILGNAQLPPQPTVIFVPVPVPGNCPPVSPTIYVNPHENNHINTAHPSAIRVNVLGSSGFDPTTINPATVHLGGPAMSAISGAPSILNFERNVNHDQFPDETFVFDGLGVNLPPGVTDAEISGQTNTGQIFVSTVKVFNRDSSFYSQSQINQQQAKFAKYDQQHNISVTDGNFIAPPPVIPKAAQQRAASMAINDLYNPFQGQRVPRQVNSGAVGATQPASASATSGPVVSIHAKNGKAVKAKAVSVNMAGHSAPQGPSIQQILAGGA